MSIPHTGKSPAEIESWRNDIRAYRSSVGKKAMWDCDFPSCQRSVADKGVVLRRMNPKGEEGIFECGRHEGGAE